MDWRKAIIYWPGSKAFWRIGGVRVGFSIEVSRNDIDQWIRRTALQQARVPTAPGIMGRYTGVEASLGPDSAANGNVGGLTKGIEDGTGLPAYLTFWELSRWYTYGAVGSSATARWRASISDRWRQRRIPLEVSHQAVGEPPTTVDVAFLLSYLNWQPKDLAACLDLSESTVVSWFEGRATPDEANRRQLQWILDEIDLMKHHESTSFSRVIRDVCDSGAEGTLEIYGRPAAGGALQRIPGTAFVDAVIDPIRGDGEAALFDQNNLSEPSWVGLKFKRDNVLVWGSHARPSRSLSAAWPSEEMRPAALDQTESPTPVPWHDVGEEYRARIQALGRYPTAAEDYTWRKERGLKRDAVRELRRSHLSPEKKKGGHPRKKSAG